MQIYNSQSRKKEEFKPVNPNEVKMYSCGPTVYNYFHIGNARPFIIFDILRRYLEYKGYKVTFVQNFTDIDDKMINRANKENITVQELADRFINEYFVDAKSLGIKPATIHPRATQHMEQIIDLIKKLEQKGLAYNVDGDVYYRVSAFSQYGNLCGQNLEDLESGARVGVEEKKENPLDFALWKKQKQGEPAWESPWGLGRPGWHIECSAMSMQYLGETFDIHGGGKDLLFPHHENEIAQSEGATGKKYVNYWMHNAFLNVNNEKMGKSKGNFFMVRDIAKEYDLEAVRLFMLSAHYRSPMNFSRELMMQATSSLARLYGARDQLDFLMKQANDSQPTNDEKEIMNNCDELLIKFENSMDDDLNTADALSNLFELSTEVFKFSQTNISKTAVQHVQSKMLVMTEVLGLVTKEKDNISQDVLEMAKKREQAREDKNWKLSDELRDAIIEAGYLVEDTKAGQKIRKGI